MLHRATAVASRIVMGRSLTPTGAARSSRVMGRCAETDGGNCCRRRLGSSNRYAECTRSRWPGRRWYWEDAIRHDHLRGARRDRDLRGITWRKRTPPLARGQVHEIEHFSIQRHKRDTARADIRDRHHASTTLHTDRDVGICHGRRAIIASGNEREKEKGTSDHQSLECRERSIMLLLQSGHLNCILLPNGRPRCQQQPRSGRNHGEPWIFAYRTVARSTAPQPQHLHAVRSFARAFRRTSAASRDSTVAR